MSCLLYVFGNQRNRLIRTYRGSCHLALNGCTELFSIRLHLEESHGRPDLIEGSLREASARDCFDPANTALMRKASVRFCFIGI